MIKQLEEGDIEGRDYHLAIWQLMRYMKTAPEDYALALTPSYRRYVEAVQYPLKKLGIKIFYVEEKQVYEA